MNSRRNGPPSVAVVDPASACPPLGSGIPAIVRFVMNRALAAKLGEMKLGEIIGRRREPGDLFAE